MTDSSIESWFPKDYEGWSVKIDYLLEKSDALAELMLLSLTPYYYQENLHTIETARQAHKGPITSIELWRDKIDISKHDDTIRQFTTGRLKIRIH